MLNRLITRLRLLAAAPALLAACEAHLALYRESDPRKFIDGLQIVDDMMIEAVKQVRGSNDND